MENREKRQKMYNTKRKKTGAYKLKKDIQLAKKVLELELSFYNCLFNTDYSFDECLDAHNMALSDLLKEYSSVFDYNYLNEIAL
jgi:hypothetical protein